MSQENKRPRTDSDADSDDDDDGRPVCYCCLSPEGARRIIHVHDFVDLDVDAAAHYCCQSCFEQHTPEVAPRVHGQYYRRRRRARAVQDRASGTHADAAWAALTDDARSLVSNPSRGAVRCGLCRGHVLGLEDPSLDVRAAMQAGPRSGMLLTPELLRALFPDGITLQDRLSHILEKRKRIAPLALTVMAQHTTHLNMALLVDYLSSDLEVASRGMARLLQLHVTQQALGLHDWRQLQALRQQSATVDAEIARLRLQAMDETDQQREQRDEYRRVKREHNALDSSIRRHQAVIDRLSAPRDTAACHYKRRRKRSAPPVPAPPAAPLTEQQQSALAEARRGLEQAQAQQTDLQPAYTRLQAAVDESDRGLRDKLSEQQRIRERKRQFEESVDSAVASANAQLPTEHACLLLNRPFWPCLQGWRPSEIIQTLRAGAAEYTGAPNQGIAVVEAPLPTSQLSLPPGKDCLLCYSVSSQALVLMKRDPQGRLEYRQAFAVPYQTHTRDAFLTAHQQVLGPLVQSGATTKTTETVFDASDIQDQQRLMAVGRSGTVELVELELGQSVETSDAAKHIHYHNSFQNGFLDLVVLRKVPGKEQPDMVTFGNRTLDGIVHSGDRRSVDMLGIDHDVNVDLDHLPLGGTLLFVAVAFRCRMDHFMDQGIQIHMTAKTGATGNELSRYLCNVTAGEFEADSDISEHQHLCICSIHKDWRGKTVITRLNRAIASDHVDIQSRHNQAAVCLFATYAKCLPPPGPCPRAAALRVWEKAIPAVPAPRVLVLDFDYTITVVHSCDRGIDIDAMTDDEIRTTFLGDADRCRALTELFQHVAATTPIVIASFGSKEHIMRILQVQGLAKYVSRIYGHCLSEPRQVSVDTWENPDRAMTGVTMMPADGVDHDPKRPHMLYCKAKLTQHLAPLPATAIFVDDTARNIESVKRLPNVTVNPVEGSVDHGLTVDQIQKLNDTV